MNPYNNYQPSIPNQENKMSESNQMLPGPPAYYTANNVEDNNSVPSYPIPQAQYTTPTTSYPVPQAQYTTPTNSNTVPQPQYVNSQPQYAVPQAQYIQQPQPMQIPQNAQIIQLPPGTVLPPGAQIVYVEQLPQKEGINQPQQRVIGSNGQPIPQAQMPVPLMLNQPVNMSDPFDILMKVPKLVIKQSIEWADVIVGYDQANKYKVYIPDANGEVSKAANPVYKAFEDNNCCFRQMGPSLPTKIDVFNCATSTKIMTINKTFGTNNCICCLPEITIEDGSGQLLGTVHSDCQICGDKFTVYNSSGEVIDYIIGPCCQMGKCCTCPCEPFNKYKYFYIYIVIELSLIFKVLETMGLMDRY